MHQGELGKAATAITYYLLSRLKKGNVTRAWAGSGSPSKHRPGQGRGVEASASALGQACPEKSGGEVSGLSSNDVQRQQSLQSAVG